MDASTLAASALALANETSQTAAVQERLREREALAMEKEDYRSFIWQRHYLPTPADDEFPMTTWRDAFMYQADELDRVRDGSRTTIRTLRQTLDNLEGDLDSVPSVALELDALQTAAVVGAAVEPTARPAEEPTARPAEESETDVEPEAAGGLDRSRSPRR